MSLSFYAIDLNSVIVPVEPNSTIDEVNLLESKSETLMEPSSDQSIVGVRSIDEVRGSGEANEGILRNENERGIQLETVDNVSNINENGADLGLNNEVSGLGSMVNENNENMVNEEEKVSEVRVSQHTVGELNAINLIVDLNPRSSFANRELSSGKGFGNNGIEIKAFSGSTDIPFSDGLGGNVNFGTTRVDSTDKRDKLTKELAKDVERSGNGCQTEKEGEYDVSNLVWGKVKSHPWWPGQIFDALASAEKARKHFKKDSFLIAYFGDQTFAWNDALQIKPFRMHFDRMEKQSNSEAFHHAVDCALDEVSRRVEFGLACSCLSEEVYGKIKSQFIINAGIREESRRIEGRDNFSSVASFIPAKVVQNVKELAQDPLGGTSRLDFFTVRSQLLAFNRWKGYYQHPALNLLDGLLENDVDFTLFGEDEVSEDAVPDSAGEQVLSGKGKSISQDRFLRKRKHILTGEMSPSKKERCLSDLMSGDYSSIPNGENKSEKSGRKRKVVDSLSNDVRAESETVDKTSLISSPQNRFRVEDHIGRIASQLSGSNLNLRNGDRSSQETVRKSGRKPAKAPHCAPPSSCKKSKTLKVPAEYPPTEELLSQLCLAAIHPMKEHSFSISAVNFFSDFRNSHLREDKMVTEKAYIKQTVKTSPLSESVEASELNGKTLKVPAEYPPTEELLSQVCLAAIHPMKEHSFLISVVNFFSDFRNSHFRDNKMVTEKADAKQTVKTSPLSETIEASELKGMEDSYWTDRTIQSNPDEQVLFDSSPKPDYIQETSVDDKCKENSGTALILKFNNKDSVPSEANLNKIFSRYGTLKESETEVLKKKNRAKVVFERRSDAETAFSSAGKFSIFGPSLVSYRLDYSPTPHKAPTPGRKRSENDATTSVKAIQFKE